MHYVNAGAKEKYGKRRMHVDSSQVEEALNPVRGVRDALRRKGIEPRDYARQNIRAVKQTSRMNALRKTNRQEEAPRSCERRRPIATPKSISEEDAKNNHVLRNILEVGGKTEKVMESSAANLWTERDGYGQVPQYLQLRKLQLAQERDAKQRAKRTALCPPGMRLMNGDEQREALETIVSNKTTVETQLQNLPLIVETPSLIKLKTELDVFVVMNGFVLRRLERRLLELEEAERIFTRPSVIVKF